MSHEHSNTLCASTARGSADDSPPPEVESGVLNYPPNSKTILVAGFSALYESQDRPGLVCKVPYPWPNFEEAFEIEKRVYKRLGEHPNLVKLVDVDQHGIWLERAAYGCLRQFHMEGGEASLERRLQWCEDVARVLDYVHSKGVRHADLSGRNLLVDADKRILLCDFGGSSIDGERATICAEAGYRHPNKDEHTEPTIRCEIHTLGSTMYEIITTREPYHGQEKEAVEKLMEQGRYPDVSNVVLGDIMQKCWEGTFGSAAEVADEVARCRLSVAEEIKKNQITTSCIK